MSEENSSSLFRTLGVTPEQIIGYSYSGLLVLLCMAIANPQFIKTLEETLGGVLLLPIVIAIGIGIYTIYFRIIGELFLYPFQYILHHLFDKIRSYSGNKHTATISYLAYLGVPPSSCHAAYQEIKASFYSDEERRPIQLSHGELHVLYLTAVILSGFAVYNYLLGEEVWQFAVIAAICLVGALIGDTAQQSLETALIKSKGRENIKKHLVSKGLLPLQHDRVLGDNKGNKLFEGHIDHVGIVSNNVELFEQFWCHLMGFHKIYENQLSSEMTEVLFNIKGGAYVSRYHREGSIQLEIHIFEDQYTNTQDTSSELSFGRKGLNHLCLHVNDRKELLSLLPVSVKRFSYDNPGGWENIFIQDFEGNWIELRETLPESKS